MIRHFFEWLKVSFYILIVAAFFSWIKVIKVASFGGTALSDSDHWGSKASGSGDTGVHAGEG